MRLLVVSHRPEDATSAQPELSLCVAFVIFSHNLYCLEVLLEDPGMISESRRQW